MKDFKKCGLTCPPRLLKETLSIIKEKIPWIIEDLYDNIYLTVDNIRLKTKRGYILGMANYLFTFIQLGIYYLTK